MLKSSRIVLILAAFVLSVYLKPLLAQDKGVDLTKLEPITAENSAKVRELDPPFYQIKPGYAVRRVDFSADDSKLAAGNWFDGGLVWSLDPLTEINSLPYNIPLCNMGFSPDGSLVVMNDNATIYVWDVISNEEVAAFDGYKTDITHCASFSFSPDGTVLAYISKDGSVALWNIVDKKEAHVLPTAVADFISVSPDSQWLAVATMQGQIELWDLAITTKIWTLKGHNDKISSMRFSPDSTLLATGGYDYHVHLWDLATGQSIHQMENNDSFVAGIASLTFSPDGSLLAFSGEHSAWVWDVKQWKQSAAFPDYTHPGKLIFSPDGSLIVFGTPYGTLNLWDFSLNTYTEVEAFEMANWINDVAITSDGRLIATADESGGVRLWGVPSD